MSKELVVKKCMSCGAMVIVLEDCTCENCGIKCCGEEMAILEPNTVDAAVEKHVPVYEKVEDEIVVRVGKRTLYYVDCTSKRKCDDKSRSLSRTRN